MTLTLTLQPEAGASDSSILGLALTLALALSPLPRLEPTLPVIVTYDQCSGRTQVIKPRSMHNPLTLTMTLPQTTMTMNICDDEPFLHMLIAFKELH